MAACTLTYGHRNRIVICTIPNPRVAEFKLYVRLRPIKQVIDNSSRSIFTKGIFSWIPDMNSIAMVIHVYENG